MKSTRRKFLGVSAGAAAAALARPAAVSGQAAPAATPAPSPTPGEKKPSLLQQAARERYGKYLTEEQAAQLDERIANLERTSARLRGFKFANGEEPTTDFRVQRPSFASASAKATADTKASEGKPSSAKAGVKK